MTQNARVIRIIDAEHAEVVVERGTACGSNCGNCETCMYARSLTVTAKNLIAAGVGDRVTVSSPSAGIIGASLRVYALPLVTFLLGYAAAALMGLGQTGCIAVSIAAFFAGVGASVWITGKKKQTIEVNITGILT